MNFLNPAEETLNKIDFCTYRDFSSLMSKQIIKKINSYQFSMAQPQKADEMPILSICDVMRDNTNNVIMKVEGLVPTYIENITDLQAEYLRIARDFFGTCYIAEKKLCDKMGVDQKSIEGFDNYLKTISKFVAFQIDMANDLQKTIGDNLMSGMKIYDDYVKLMLSSYARMLEYASSFLPEKEIIDLLGKKPLAILS